MASFQGVMREWKRMCAYETDKAAKEQRPCGMVCPVGPLSVCGECADWREEDFARAETLIIDWADEHPAPQYPTWAEWLAENGILGVETRPRASSTTSASTTYVQTVRTLPQFYRPIPADIAEKLGIEPKGADS